MCPKEALPKHLQDRNHKDWPFPMSLIKRGFNAFGPRIPEGTFGHLPWPPRLVKGYNITKWERTDEKGCPEKIYIPDFFEKVITKEVYDYPVIDSQGNRRSLLLEAWWPSIIPEDPTKGWLITEPWHCASWDQRPGWKRYYFRVGARPDFEMYYNVTPIPYIGRNPE